MATKRKKQIITEAGQVLRYCPDCGDYLTTDKFSVCSRSKHGFSIYCAKHMSERAKASQEKRRDEAIARRGG